MFTHLLFAVAAANSEEPSLWSEIWSYIKETYFTPDSIYFENLGFGLDTMRTISMILIGLFIGIIIAAFAIVIDKRVLGEFVRKLLKEDCTSPEKAKTLYDLGFVLKYAVRNGVKKGTNLRSVVVCKEEEEYNRELDARRAEYEKKRSEDKSLPPFKEVPYSVNTETDHFYIPESKKYVADVRFDKKGSTWIVCFLMIFIFIIVFAVLLLVLPDLLLTLDSFVGSFNSGPGNILT